jgi:pimeloyl-ACP methyl ester carboxylesterase
MIKVAVALLVAATLPAVAVPAEVASEAWVGELDVAGRAIALRLSFHREGEALRGVVKPLNPLGGMGGATVSDVVRSGAAISFKVGSAGKAFDLSGTVAETEMAGTVRVGGADSGSFRFVRALALGVDGVRPYEGFYGAVAGERWAVFAMTQPDGSVDAFGRHSPSGRFARLVAVAPDRFAATASQFAVFPVDFSLTFRRDPAGRVAGMEVSRGDRQPERAARLEVYGRREVSFTNGDVRLDGDLLLPVGRGPHPGVVLIHGSGPGPRSQLAAMALFFAERGIAVLSYDKRGCGTSTGDWKRADFPELAADALAGIRLLQETAGIDPRRIGLYGISQGGWVAPLAASLSRDVAFVIAHSGPGVTPLEQDLFATGNQLARYGLEPRQVGIVLSAYRVLYDHVAGRLPAAALDATVAELRKDAVLAQISPPLSSELENLEETYRKQAIGDPGWYMHLDVSHDPLAVYRKVTCPVLAIFGEFDWMVPVTRSAAEIEKALRDGGNRDFAVRTFARAGHGLLETTGPGPVDLATPARVVPGMLEAMSEWLGRVAAPRED